MKKLSHSLIGLNFRNKFAWLQLTLAIKGSFYSEVRSPSDLNFQVVVRQLPHEVHHVEPVLRMLESQEATATQHW